MKEFDDIELSNKTPVHMESRNVLGNTKGSSPLKEAKSQLH